LSRPDGPAGIRENFKPDIYYLARPQRVFLRQDHSAGYIFAVTASQVGRSALSGLDRFHRVAIGLQTADTDGLFRWQNFQLITLSDLAGCEGSRYHGSKTLDREAPVDR